MTHDLIVLALRLRTFLMAGWIGQDWKRLSALVGTCSIPSGAFWAADTAGLHGATAVAASALPASLLFRNVASEWVRERRLRSYWSAAVGEAA